MADIRVKDLDEASVPGDDYYLLTDSATDGVKKVKTTNVVVPVASGVSGLGTGVAAFLATPSSANLASALTDETGSGAAVFATSPTLVTPTLGDASATSVNKVAVTAPATGATLTIADGKTLTASDDADVSGTNTGDQTITLTGDVTGTGTGSFAVTIGATKVTSAMLNSDVFSTAHTWSGQQTFVAPALGTPASGTATNLTGTAAGLTAGNVTTNANLTGDVTSVGNASTIAANAVTNAKLATAADGTIKSNISGGTATPSDNTITAVLDKLFGTTQGSVVYRGASTWGALTPGTSGNFLKTQGASANPIWDSIPGGGDMLSTNNLSDLTDFTAARTALGIETLRQNVLLDRIYQAKLYALPRRVINAFADGFASTDGINSGSSSNYAAVSGYVHPSGNATVQINAASSTISGQGFTFIDRTTAVPNGTVVTKVGFYSTVARTIKVKIVLRNSANNYTVVVDQSYSHGGTGWEDVTLSSPYTVPGSGTYYLAAYIGAGGSNPNVTAAVSRAYVNSDLTGTGATTAEDSNTAFPLRYTTQINNMTLVTASQTTDASIGNVRAIIEYFYASPLTVGTDFTIELTCDGGSHWTSAPVTPLTSNGQQSRIPAESADTACTAGTSFAARIKTLTNKDILFTGLSLVVH